MWVWNMYSINLVAENIREVLVQRISMDTRTVHTFKQKTKKPQKPQQQHYRIPFTAATMFKFF